MIIERKMMKYLEAFDDVMNNKTSFSIEKSKI